MKSTWLYTAAIAVAALIAMLAFVFMPVASPPKPELDQSRIRTSAKGLFVAEIQPEKPEIKQGELHSWVLTLKTADGKPVEDASIDIGGGMPDHNHGLPTSPQVTEYLGQGRLPRRRRQIHHERVVGIALRHLVDRRDGRRGLQSGAVKEP